MRRLLPAASMCSCCASCWPLPSFMLCGILRWSQSGPKHFSDFLVGILMGVILFCFLLPAVANLLLRLRGTAPVLLIILCLHREAVFGLLRCGSPSRGDYAVFWGYANALSQQAVLSGGRYMALFPHIFGYSQVLSLFLALFGSHPWLPPLLNVLLSVCSGYFLFRLCLQWLSLRAAVYGFLLWIICPSQTIYNSLVLSEPLYTALILGFLLVVTNAFDGRVRTRPVLSAARPACWRYLAAPHPGVPPHRGHSDPRVPTLGFS